MFGLKSTGLRPEIYRASRRGLVLGFNKAENLAFEMCIFLSVRAGNDKSQTHIKHFLYTCRIKTGLVGVIFSHKVLEVAKLIVSLQVIWAI